MHKTYNNRFPWVFTKVVIASKSQKSVSNKVLFTKITRQKNLYHVQYELLEKLIWYTEEPHYEIQL